MATELPYDDRGIASFETVDEYTNKWLLAGSHPELAPALGLPMANSQTLKQFSVVGKNSAGKIVMATRGDAAAAATGVITFSGVGSADDEVVIGGVTYVLKAAPAAAYEVDIGGDAATTAANLAAAINVSGTAGTEYGEDTQAHPEVSASVDGAVVTVTAKQVGDESNDIPTTETSSAASWAATTLTGGRDQGGVQPIGVLAHAATLGVSGSANAQVWYSGCFNHAALVWDESFDSVADKKDAFFGAPTPTNIIIGERF